MITHFKNVCILVCCFLLSCKQLKISENETKAIQEIANLYGGNFGYSIKLGASTKSGNTNTFGIEVSNSEFINQNKKLAEMYASNMAYTFFKLTKGEANKYNSIVTTIEFDQGEQVTYEYNMEMLKTVEDKMIYVQKIVDILKRKDYKRISEKITTGAILAEENRDKYIEKLKSMDSTFGDIYDFTPTGFRVGSNKENKQILHIAGSLKRSKTDSQFSIDISPAPNFYEFYYIDYSF
jgi:hypothetical protein